METHTQPLINMTNIVCTLSNGGVTVHYCSEPKRKTDPDTGAEQDDLKHRVRCRHRMRIREIILGGVFVIYNSEMNFDYAISKGHTLKVYGDN